LDAGIDIGGVLSALAAARDPRELSVPLGSPGVSYMDLLDPSLDLDAPGPLLCLALLGSSNHNVPACLAVCNAPLPQLLVREAVASDSACAQVSGESYSGEGLRASYAPGSLRQPSPLRAARALVPPDMYIADEVLSSSAQLTLNSLLFNSRTAFDMFLQAWCMYESERMRWAGGGNPRGPGLFDCPIIMGHDLPGDPRSLARMVRLAVRYLPVGDCMRVKAPYARPARDELRVAVSLFENLRGTLDPGLTLQWVDPTDAEAIERAWNPVSPLTSDYLAGLVPGTVHGVALVCRRAADALARAALNASPTQLSADVMAGCNILRLYTESASLGDAPLFTRPCELSESSHLAWCGLALYLVSLLQAWRRRHPESASPGVVPESERDSNREFEEKINVSDVLAKLLEVSECLLESGASLRSGEGRYVYVAVAETLLDFPDIDGGPGRAQTALHLLDRVHPSGEVIPLVANKSGFTSVLFEKGAVSLTSWNVSRLRAVALQVCGTPVEAAEAYKDALRGIGGVLPGRSASEIAERVLLMAEASAAFESCGRLDEAESVMANGLTHIL